MDFVSIAPILPGLLRSLTARQQHQGGACDLEPYGTISLPHAQCSQREESAAGPQTHLLLQSASCFRNALRNTCILGLGVIERESGRCKREGGNIRISNEDDEMQIGVSYYDKKKKQKKKNYDNNRNKN